MNAYNFGVLVGQALVIGFAVFMIYNGIKATK